MKVIKTPTSTAASLASSKGIMQIAGAGPAGLAAAITPARAGRAVVVHESKPGVWHRFQGNLQGVERYCFTLLVSVSLFLVGCDSLDPEEIRKRQHFPGKDFVADAQQGETLFVENCSQCHGPSGRGTGQGPALIDKIYRPAHHADITFHWAVKNGVKQHHWGFGNMPPIKNVSPEDVGHIIAYIRQQQRNAGIQ